MFSLHQRLSDNLYPEFNNIMISYLTPLFFEDTHD
jgi:hypothetical protein